MTVITCVPNVPTGIVYEGYRNALFQREAIEGISVIRVWSYMAANAGTVRRILNYVSFMFCATVTALFIRKPDIIVATSPQFFCGWAGVFSSRLRRTPLILEIRDIWPESIKAVGAMHSGNVLRILEWLELQMYAAARNIVTVGEGYKQRLLGKGVPEKDITVVMNGVDPDTFFPREPDQTLIADLGLESKFICGYLGTIGMACGLHVVLECAEQLKKDGDDEIAFLLVGDGAARKQLENEACHRGLDNVVFMGLQDKKSIPALLSITDACLVHLRKNDLFRTVMPSKIFEATGMARPIIIGVDGYAARFVEEVGCGISIEPENAVELLTALRYLVAHPHAAITMGQLGHEYVSERFDWNDLAQQYAGVLDSVLKTE